MFVSEAEGRLITKGDAVRTCVGCGRRDSRDSLLRLVQSPKGRLAVDLRAARPGRGAWVHPNGCIEALVKSPGRLHRTLRAEQTLDMSALVQCETESLTKTKEAGWKLMGTR